MDIRSIDLRSERMAYAASRRAVVKGLGALALSPVAVPTLARTASASANKKKADCYQRCWSPDRKLCRKRCRKH